MGTFKTLRHAVGWIGLAAWPVLIVSALLGSWIGFAAGVALGWLVPVATMVVHLSTTHCLSRQEKARWWGELCISYHAVFAVWTYLLSRDLVKATQGLRPERP